MTPKNTDCSVLEWAVLAIFKFSEDSTALEMDAGVVHSHPGVAHGPPSVVHGAGPDGEHSTHGPGRRYQNRPKPNNNLEQLPLDEAAKREMESLPMKTPVSVLHELFKRRGTVPKYELIQIEGLIHEPTFRYRVTVADFIALGTGRSKKEAKHSAAKALLDKLTEATPADQQPANESVPESGVDVVSFEKENPVGWLQELSMSRYWPLPIYSAENDDNVNGRLSHERQFTIVCTLKQRCEMGTGKTKKLAKRQAAYKMWQALHDDPSDSVQPDEESGVATRYAELKNSKIPTLTTTQSHKVSQFHKNLKKCVGPNLEKLQVTPLKNTDFHCVKFLQEIACEQEFDVTYVHIEEKSKSGWSQCLVQLSTPPVAVCYGTGLTSKDAQASAAQNALEYLKILTMK